MLWYLLLVFILIAAVLYIVWAHRRRAAARAAASSKRFEEIFGAAAQRAATAGGASSAATIADAAPPASVPTSAPVSPRRVPAAYLKRGPLLNSQHAFLFHALVTALPDCHVFVHVSLAALIEVPHTVQGREREQRVRALAQNVVDCVVCSKSMEAIAAIDLEAAESAEWRIKAECLKAAGVRYVRAAPGALSKTEELRALILGVAC